MRFLRWLCLVPPVSAMAMMALGCGTTAFSDEATLDGGTDSGVPAEDAVSPTDAGRDASALDHSVPDAVHVDVVTPSEASSPIDATPLDVGPPIDATRPRDASRPPDSGGPPDAGKPVDGGMPDDAKLPPHDGPHPKDAGGPPDAGRGSDAAGTCVVNSDCPVTGTFCAFLIADGCAAKGMCMLPPPPTGCGAIIQESACSCEGMPVTWTAGCTSDYAQGYAPVPVEPAGLCAM